MQISYPYLPPKKIDENIEDYDKRVSGFVLDHGIYPVSFDMCWHGGCHMYASDTLPEPVRAIADGEIIAYRRSTNPANYKQNESSQPLEFDTSFVLLKHSMKTGSGIDVIFYSLYMHLMNETDLKKLGSSPPISKAVRAPTGTAIQKPAPGNIIKRKDILGYAGSMYRKADTPTSGYKLFHFEIFTTEEHFKKFWQDSKKNIENKNQNGFSGPWGSVYYIIPKDTEFKSKPLHIDTTNKKFQKITNETKSSQSTLGKNKNKLYVEVKYINGSKHVIVMESKDDGSLNFLTKETGEIYKNDEYNLFDRAKIIFPQTPNAGYELLRFGRIIGPEKIPEEKLENWQPITFESGKIGYIDLSRTEILKLSDADFPHFKGWQLIDEDDGAFKDDGLCDISLLKKLLLDADTNLDKTLSEAEWASYAKGEGKEKLKRLICKSPTEWHSNNNEKRFARLTEENGPFNKNPEAFKNFLDHLKEMQFWSETNLPTSILHFHPLEFIRHFRESGWPNNGGVIPWLLYPLATKATADYHTGARVFGYRRSAQRKHAGIDLYGQLGTEIRAMTHGIVSSVSSFYCQTSQVTVNHGSFIARYGEVDPRTISVKAGDLVKRGQRLAGIGHLIGIKVPSDMLHLEFYKTTESELNPLTNRETPPYQRRNDVFDATDSIDIAEFE